LNQLDINLETLLATQEQLLITIDYLQKTSVPFIVLSYIGVVETYLDKQRLKITSIVEVLHEAIWTIR